jgi:8-oxo-dGTP pyrophosphatase MutT (NUDIX family)
VTDRPPTWPVSIKGVAVDAHGQVLLLRNERQEWELPGGRLETGDPAAGTRGDDSPEQALEREILEETGWEVKAGPLIAGGTWIYEPIPGDGHLAGQVRVRYRSADGDQRSAIPGKTSRIPPAGAAHSGALATRAVTLLADGTAAITELRQLTAGQPAHRNPGPEGSGYAARLGAADSTLPT